MTRVLQWLARRLGVARSPDTPLAAVRWVVIDCETSGLDPLRDRLISIGALAVRANRVEFGECFSAMLQQPRPSAPANILIHGIGGDAQLAGRPAAEVLPEFAQFAGDAIAVGFDAWFDEAVLRRAMAQVPGLTPPRIWLDLARLAPALFPRRRSALRSLDDWLREFGIEPYKRHDALGDAFTAAQLLLVLLAKARQQGVVTLEGVLSRSG